MKAYHFNVIFLYHFYLHNLNKCVPTYYDKKR